MSTLKALSLATVCGFLSLCVQAQSTKPGLWEMTSKIDPSGNSAMAKQMEQMQKQMAAMPPEQRKTMEDMMAKQGMNMSFGAGGATTMKICVTPEMASRPPVEQRKNCTYNYPARSGATQRFSFQCTQPAGGGEGELVFKNESEYDGKMKITRSENGKNETMTMLTRGKFLSANCGNIKPLVAPKG